ncbi:hypothetical protein [Daejeonella lutea]|nr:hypothetical protein [Daejeonella lutea]
MRELTQGIKGMFCRQRLLCLLGFLLLVSDTFAQSVSLDSISSRFNRFSKSNLQEKVYLHTDKDLYLAGEIVWFKVYNVGSESNSLLDFSKIAYTEILDQDHKPVMQAKIALDKGTGNGSLHLPGDLSSGTYRIRSYTSWMKNFSADYFFEKPLHIVNTLAKPVRLPTASVRNYDIQFFPEGGSLVEGLASKVGFRVVDDSGRGVDFRGSIVDERNDTITRFRPLKFGIGNFIMETGSNKSYKAVLNLPGGQTRTVDLPQPNKSGFVMSLSETSGKLNVSIAGNTSDAREILLLVHTRQQTRLAEKLRLNEGKAVYQIDKSILGDGISHFTVFSSSGQPVAERLYFKRPSSKLTFTVKPDQLQYGKRKKVTLDLAAITENGAATLAEASVGVYASNGLSSNSTDILNYLWLKSDLRGNIEDPGYYLKNTDPQANEALDNLMLTHGWRRFVWEEAMGGKPAAITFLPEIEGHIISAKLTDSRTNSPAGGIVSYLSVPGKNVRLYTARSNTSGDLKFYTKDIYGPSELVAQTNYKQDSTYHIELLSPFSAKTTNYSLLSDPLTENFKDELLTLSVGNQVQNVYLNEKLRTFYAKPQDSVSFYLKPDKSYLLDNFVRFNTMEEVLREYVLEVPVTRQRDEFSVWVSFKPHYNDTYKNVEPLVLYDGVPVFDRGTKMVKYDPKKVKTIDVLTKKYYQGPVTFNSIINFKSYKNNLPDFQLDSRATVVDYEGTQLRREFYSPVYETEAQAADRLPDFRNLLFWLPDAAIDASGKRKMTFYTSDQKGKYTIVVQGITPSGQPGVASSTFEVK